MPVTPYTRVTCDLAGCGFSSDDPAEQGKFVKLTAEVADLGSKVEGVYCTKQHAQAAMNALPADGANPAPATETTSADAPSVDPEAAPEQEDEEEAGPEEATVVRAARVAQSAWLRIPRARVGSA